jgi:hypothetical protein
MKDRKNKKDEQPKDKIIVIKAPKFEKYVLESFTEIIAPKLKRASFTLKTKSSHKTINKGKLTASKLMLAIQKNLIRRHSCTVADYNDNIVDNLIYNKNCHMVSVFKDYMITDYIDEFLKRIYKVNECVERIPKIANYYKNYLKFFCNPIFRDFKINNIVQSYGDYKAEIYYNNNYGGKKREKDKLCDDNIRNIFNTTIKENIDKNSLTRTTIQDDVTIFESEMNYKPMVNNFGIRDYYIEGLNLMDFNDSHSTLRSHLITVKSKEESIIYLLSGLENNNKYYVDKCNEKVIKEFENKVIGKEVKRGNSTMDRDTSSMTKKASTARAKSDKNVEGFVSKLQTPIQGYNHVKQPSLNRPPSSLKLHSGEFKNIKLSKTNNFFSTTATFNNKQPVQQPGHTKNSSSHPSHDFNTNTSNNKQFLTNTISGNTPVLNKEANGKYTNRLYQSTLNSSRLKKNPESRLSAHQNCSIKLNAKGGSHIEIKPEKRISTSELQGKQINVIQNNLNSINDIMKITLSLCVDKSSRNRPLSNHMLNTNTGNHFITNPLTQSISNFNIDKQRTTIINKVDNINNFNININNQINLPDNIQSSLLNTLPIQITTKPSPIANKELSSIVIEKNKILSRTRNKDTNIYKMPSNSIKTIQFDDENNKKKTFYKDTLGEGKFFNSYNAGKFILK